MILRRIAIAVATLAVFVVPARSGTVTYSFVESSGGSGGIGASLTLDTPLPAASASDIASFQILDSAIAPMGDYTAGFPPYSTNVVSPIGSSTGAMLDSGQLTTGSLQSSDVYVVDATFSTVNNGSTIASEAFYVGVIPIGGNTVYGNWLLASAVPEPSSLVLAGLATVAGMGSLFRARCRRIAHRDGCTRRRGSAVRCPEGPWRR